jgi:hypothetical protein
VSEPGPDTVRRTLLVLVTGLIVARPVVPGESPGLLSDLEGPGSMVLILLWLFAGVVWAGWRLWSRQGDLRLGWVEAAFFALVVLVFVGAGTVAVYKHPAWLISWEWGGLALAFFLVRQVATGRDEQQGLFAALLAGAVALSASAVHQAVEFPKAAPSPEELSKSLSRRGIVLDEGELERYYLRLRDRDVTASFTWPGSFAAYLALLLPGLVGAVVVCRRVGAPRPQTIAAGVCALLGAAALLLTHSGAGLLAVLVVGAFVAAWARFPPGWQRPAAALAGLTVLAGGGYALIRGGTFGEGTVGQAWDDRLDVWSATWRLIQERPWLGVGPGNFANYYPRFMAETAWEKAREPHNFLLEVWSSYGAFALLALLAALALFFRQVALRWRDLRLAPAPAGGDAGALPPVRWEYYLGGMFGILLGFVLRASWLPPGDVLNEAIGAGVRSLAWFAAFAVFERVPWSDRDRLACLAAGVAAAFLCLAASDGIGFPAVAGPLWVAVALALAITAPAPLPWIGRQHALLFAPVPVLAALGLAYALFVFLPMTASANVTQQALANGTAVRGEKDLPEKERETRDKALNYLFQRVLPYLEKAAREVPDNARAQLRLVEWYGEAWELDPRNTRFSSTIDAAALQAQKLNPESRECYFRAYLMRRNVAAALAGFLKEQDATFKKRLADQDADFQKRRAEQAKDPKLSAKDRQLAEKKFQEAQKLAEKNFQETQKRVAALFEKHRRELLPPTAKALRKCVELDPTDARLRAQLAEVLFEWAAAVSQDKPAKGERQEDLEALRREGRKEAAEALRLDKLHLKRDQVTHRLRRLTPRQLEQVLGWLYEEQAKKPG